MQLSNAKIYVYYILPPSQMVHVCTITGTISLKDKSKSKLNL